MAPGPPETNPAAPKAKSSAIRKASPPRADTEKTFQQKLDEIKRQRATTTSSTVERRRVIVNGKPSLAVSGDWALFASSSGRQYYFNLKTLVNQWQKPTDWCDIQAGIATPASNNGPPQPQPPQGDNGLGSKPPIPPPSSSEAEAQVNGGFKMKIKHHGKHKLKDSGKLNDEVEEENGQTSRLPPGKLLTGVLFKTTDEFCHSERSLDQSQLTWCLILRSTARPNLFTGESSCP